MRITCFDNRYTIEASDIVYQYDPLNDKKYKTYKAEDVIANNGDSNTIALIKILSYSVTLPSSLSRTCSPTYLTLRRTQNPSDETLLFKFQITP